ncbi:carbon-nitrogen hydrolase family protein [Ammoniphilus sp. YIM 78166]|uniref:carbon-nitrogen hydrolase family protein n=1 Tax=Ammoniphilus sp. YIM 78166 TaxID=1644106 RepID=UPI00106FBC78|nr:carbon-nitrogen hydrolase family protein [Ammoniphilus sp. YIM 78166]
MYKEIKVSVIQLGPYPGSYEKNSKVLYQLIEEVVINEQPHLIVFPELMTVPLASDVQMAEAIHRETVQNFCALASTFHVNLVGTLLEKEQTNGKVNHFHSAFVCTPTQGLLGRYRKLKGDAASPVWDLGNGFRLGTLIKSEPCDQDVWQSLCEQLVDIIAVPIAASESSQIVEELRERAKEYGVYVVASNKAGEGFSGKSCIIDPLGRIVVQAGEEEWSVITGNVIRKE